MSFPPIMLGTMYYGTRIDRDTSFRMLDMYVDRGFDLIDTANNYAFWINGSQGGESEQIIGRWLAARPDKPARIATKLGAQPALAGGDLSHVLGLSAETISSQFAASCERLGVESVELLYAHIDDHSVPFEESLGALNALVQTGTVNTIGLSNLTHSRLVEALDVISTQKITPIAAMQLRYSAIAPIPTGDLGAHVWATDDTRALLNDHEIPLVAYSPLMEGALGEITHPFPPAFDSGANQLRRTSLAVEAAARGLTLSQYSLRWLMERGITPIIGARTPEQLANALDAFA